MRVIGITSTAILGLLLGIAPAFAQHERQGEKQGRSEHQQNNHQQASPQQQHARGQGGKHAHQQHAQGQGGQHAQRQHAQRQGNGHAQRNQQQQRVQRSAWQQRRAGNWQSDHRTWQQRGGYHGYRIPDDRFRGYFGPQHGFRINGLPFLVVGGYPRFQYGGYWFSLVDPWPEYWASNWYNTDDVYVTYVDDGYYLFNRRHPSVGIAISISM